MNTEAEMVESPLPGGFWRRVGASCVDMIVLALVCYGVVLVLGDRVYLLGDWGRLIGLVIGTAYFGVMHSGRFNGQSIGKSVAGLRVVRIDGEMLSLQRSCLRASILLVPGALNGLMFNSAVYTMTDLPVWLAWTIDIALGLALFVIVFGGILSSAVLFLSDPNWRRGLHDLLAGTVVVREGRTGAPMPPPFSRLKLGFAVAAPVALVVALFAAFAVIVPDFERIAKSLDRVVEIQKSIESTWPGSKAGANLNFASGDGGAGTLVISVWLPGEPNAMDQSAGKIVTHVLEKHPDLAGAERVFVHAYGGYSLLLFSKTSAANASAQREAP